MMLPLSVWISALLLAPCRASPTVTDVQPYRIPTTGNVSLTVTVHDQPFADAIHCQINPPAKGTTHILNTTATIFPGTMVSKTQVMCMNVPKVTAPGPGILTLTFLNHQANPAATKPTVLTTNVTYFTPIDWTVSKRPYIHELDVSGEILVKLDATYFQPNEKFTISASLPAGHATWDWDLVATPATFPEYVLPLSFEQIKSSSATIHNDLQVTILRVSDGTKYSSSRRFHKVPSPPSSSTGNYS